MEKTSDSVNKYAQTMPKCSPSNKCDNEEHMNKNLKILVSLIKNCFIFWINPSIYGVPASKIIIRTTAVVV